MQHVTSAPAAPPTSTPHRTRRARRRRLGTLLGICTMVLAASACTPEEIVFYHEVSHPYQDVLTDDQLAALRQCESGGNYEIVDRSGSFRGAYQFTRGTWNSVASRHFEWLVGVDPAEADPAWQDVMARALWSERGRTPWPVCGRRV